jgi:tRNA(adenine34) deaminase
MKDDAVWMQHAIAEAEEALSLGEVPVGAVVVHEGTIIGRGYNRVEKTGFPFEHAEVVAMWDAIENRDRWALAESVLYVTVEPCVMCVGAILLARLPRLVYGAREPRTGACGSVLSIPDEPMLDHRLAVIGGVEHARCRELMQSAFRVAENKSRPAAKKKTGSQKGRIG